jgi:hypothetical protein
MLICGPYPKPVTIYCKSEPAGAQRGNVPQFALTTSLWRRIYKDDQACVSPGK